jgi:protein-tyrosine phosphatase
MPRPRGGDWLEDEVRPLRASGADVLVSLLEPQEIGELNLLEEKALCEANGITYLSFPIPDRGLPREGRDALEFARRLASLLAEGKGVVIHCRQGIGRSSMIAAITLALRGVPAGAIFEAIGQARGCSVPDTLEQREWTLGLIGRTVTPGRPA